MNKISIIPIIIILTLILSSCTTLLSGLSAVAGGMLGSSSSQSLQAQNGSNKYKANGADNKAKNVTGDQTGRDKNSYNAKTITINESSFFNMVMTLVAGISIGAYLLWRAEPKPKKLERWIKNKLKK